MDLIEQIRMDLERWDKSAREHAPNRMSPKDQEIEVAQIISTNYGHEIESHLRGIEVELGSIESAHTEDTDQSTRDADRERRDQFEKLKDVLLRKRRGEPLI